MPTVRATLAEAAERLQAVTDTPDLEATLLACHAWGWDRARLILNAQAPGDVSALEPLIQRRLRCEPIAYILGNWEFYSVELLVEAPLLVPRPETELLVDAAVTHLGTAPGRVLDLCTGTGCIAIAIARNAPVAALWATDFNANAVRVAAENARRNDVRLNVLQGDLYAPLPETALPFDVIVCNPPYVPEAQWEGLAPDIRCFEDRDALISGDDGLPCLRRTIEGAPARLRPGGLLAVEIGEDQGTAVAAIFEGHGFERVAVQRDLGGHDRIVLGYRPPA